MNKAKEKGNSLCPTCLVGCGCLRCSQSPSEHRSLGFHLVHLFPTNDNYRRQVIQLGMPLSLFLISRMNRCALLPQGPWRKVSVCCILEKKAEWEGKAPSAPVGTWVEIQLVARRLITRMESKNKGAKKKHCCKSSHSSATALTRSREQTLNRVMLTQWHAHLQK